jgi:radical SAM superfamily enzyme YgiQ (UPF0313 family)
MGFPPIGIMSLSAVLKRAGHECVMFDQANPETPNEVIIDEIRHQRPTLIGLSFLSTTSYPYAKLLARQIRAVDATVKLAFGGVFASLNAHLVKLQCPEVDFVCRGDGEQLNLDLIDRMNEPVGITGLTWMRAVIERSRRAGSRIARSSEILSSLLTLRRPSPSVRRLPSRVEHIGIDVGTFRAASSHLFS